MLFPPPSGTDKVQALAVELGCAAHDFSTPDGPVLPALLGSTGSSSMMLTEFGATWDDIDKVHVFRNWPTLEAALQHVIDQRARGV